MKKDINHGILYTLLVFTFSIIAFFWGGTLENPNVFTILWAIAPLVVSLSLRIYLKDWSDIGLKPKFRANIKWYLLSIIIFPVSYFTAIFIGESIGVSQIIDFSLFDFFKTVGIGVLVFLLLAFVEEIGWRGYLVPKLFKAGLSSQWISVYVGIIWAFWHFPYYKEFVGFSEIGFSYQSFPVFVLECIALSFIYTEIRIISNSLIPAVIFHAICNTVGHSFTAEYLSITIGKTIFGTIGYNVILLILLFFVVGIWLRKYRKIVSVK